MSDSLKPHGLQHARPSCPSSTPTVYPNLCPLNRWCHPTVSSCRPLLSPSIFLSIRVFSNESVLHIRWPKYWSFSFNICPSNEYSGMISLRIDWLDLFAVQGTLRSFLQQRSSKVSILQHSAFFMVQLSHPYMTTGRPEPWLDGPLLARLFNMLSRLLLTFLPRSKRLWNVLLSSKHLTVRPSVATILDKVFQKVNWFSANQLSSTRWSLIL